VYFRKLLFKSDKKKLSFRRVETIGVAIALSSTFGTLQTF